MIRTRLRKVIVVIGLFALTGIAMMAQAPPAAAPPSKYEPTEVQRLKLQVAQKDAQLAQVQLQRAQQAFQAALAELDAEAGRVKVANGWPSTVQFSPDTLTFVEAPKPSVAPAPPVPTAPEQKKP